MNGTSSPAKKQEGKSPKTLKTYETSFNSFECYLADNGITTVDESICLDYIHIKTGQRINTFVCVTSSTRLDYRMRPLSLLLHYLEEGQFNNKVRKTKSRFICPECFQLEYEAFCEEMLYRGYSDATVDSNIQKVRLLIGHLAEQGVLSSAEITIGHVEGFLKTLEDKAVKYVGIFLYVFRNYFSFLYDRGYIEYDLTPQLPKVRVPRNASISYIWSKEDIQKLLEAIDRSDPKGKRDYAILLIAIRLGLRIGDIRWLKQSSIDWNRSMISLTMSKTGQKIELPLLRDIGWAIINYLQNGRPVTNKRMLIRQTQSTF